MTHKMEYTKSDDTQDGVHLNKSVSKISVDSRLLKIKHNIKIEGTGRQHSGKDEKRSSKKQLHQTGMLEYWVADLY